MHIWQKGKVRWMMLKRKTRDMLSPSVDFVADLTISCSNKQIAPRTGSKMISPLII